MTHAAFSLHVQSTVLTPDVPGMATLVRCLREGSGIRAQQSTQAPIAACGGAVQWVLCETSGTSGQPKIIRRHPHTWMDSFAITKARFSIGTGDTYATLGSLGHSLTLYASVEALNLGADLCALVGISPKGQAAMIAEKHATVLYATPTQLGLLLKGAVQGKIAALAHVRFVFCGGGKLSAPVKSAVQALCPNAAVFEFFGASETSFITLSDDQAPAGSVGRSYPGVTLRIDAPAGEIGEIWITSPYLFDGYDGGDHPDTAWNDGALTIGEMGYLDTRGNLFLCGRKNRMVTVADVNVFPELVERSIAQMEGVQVNAVIGVPDPKRGNRLICFVQSADGAVDAAQIRTHCRGQIAPQAIPQDIRFVAQMPMLAAGKPDLQTLLAMAEDS
jgi:long-chain acyl-CoA synthetase